MSEHEGAVHGMPRAEVPLGLVVIHRGEPSAVMPDPWHSSSEPRLLRLARAIASSDGWACRPPASLIVLTGRDPLIAAVGRSALAGDVTAFVDQMRAAGLLVEEPA